MNEPPINIDRTHLSRRVDAHTLDALIAYVHHRRDPGSFLKAVLENDLLAAVQRSTGPPVGLASIVMAIFHTLPTACYGSKEIVHRWLNPEPSTPASAASPQTLYA